MTENRDSYEFQEFIKNEIVEDLESARREQYQLIEMAIMLNKQGSEFSEQVMARVDEIQKEVDKLLYQIESL